MVVKPFIPMDVFARTGPKGQKPAKNIVGCGRVTVWSVASSHKDEPVVKLWECHVTAGAVQPSELLKPGHK